MKIEEYAEKFSDSPLLLEELAQAALKVDDDEAFVRHAQSYLDAMKTFESALTDRDVEIG